MTEWAPVAITVTIASTLVAYLVKGLSTWGKLEKQIAELAAQTQQAQKALEQVRAEMLRPADLRSAILEMKLEVYRETMGLTRRGHEQQ